MNKLQLTIECDNVEELRTITNAQQYYNLIHDFAECIRQARKHSDDVDRAISIVVDKFYPDFISALDHVEGPY